MNHIFSFRQRSTEHIRLTQELVWKIQYLLKLWKKAEHMGLNIWAFNFQQAFGNEINFEAVIKIEGTEKPQLYAGGACSIVDQSSFAATYGLDDFFGNDLVTTQAPGTFSRTLSDSIPYL